MPGQMANAPLGQPVRALGRQRTAGRGEFEYGDMAKLGPSADWNVKLPERERAEVDQAIKDKLPARYRRQITLYYRNLAGAKAE
jgi:hypothetical protein